MAKRDPAENNIFLHKQKKLALTREGENPIYGVFTMTDGDAISQIKVEVSYEAVWELLKNHKFQTVLDVGCGRGEHAEIFRFAGKDVTTIDPIYDYADFKADFLSHPFDEKYDLVWTSHVLEHQRNVGLFIDRLLEVTEDNGLICVTVPPEVSHYFILCHPNHFTAYHLLYHLIMAGIDCRHAQVCTYGYNVSVIVRKTPNGLPKQSWAHEGEAAAFFPHPLKINNINNHDQVFGPCLALNWDQHLNVPPHCNAGL